MRVLSRDKMDITILNSKGRFTTMAKKAAATTNIAMDKSASSSAGTAPKKSQSREKKHLKAQAAGVAAAVEGFVQAIVGPAGESAAKPQEITEAVPETLAQETLSAPIAETPVHTELAKAAAPKVVSEEEIAILAYEFYLERGGQNGSQADDWLRAEKTLRAGK
jgi:hypothetical protein